MFMVQRSPDAMQIAVDCQNELDRVRPVPRCSVQNRMQLTTQFVRYPSLDRQPVSGPDEMTRDMVVWLE